jgi:hypothetical protein
MTAMKSSFRLLPLLAIVFLGIITAVSMYIALGQSNTQEKFMYQNNQRINKRTNVVAAWYDVNSRVYQGTPEQIARQFLDENKNWVSPILPIWNSWNSWKPFKVRQGIMSPFIKNIAIFGFWIRDCGKYQSRKSGVDDSQWTYAGHQDSKYHTTCCSKCRNVNRDRQTSSRPEGFH